ncbi:hypothetical protein [Kaistella pullorum]|uniref:Uncharacterized protein n=1 Tax=Kaistella pullorum TaxID=2763074 RepID=A0ABR8WMU4_9FLAO|nr:hypothetical protein [Kaistella pullorum]MBD8018392.1 hypothetical protein [Kaistella pullorum]
MKTFYFILLSLFSHVSAQEIFNEKPFAFENISDLFADDYGNIYIYKKADFSFTKYSPAGNQLGKLMFTLPFKIQSVQNPLSIPAFSENAQELRFYDQNLNLVQTVEFSPRFGFVKMAYAEDLQQIWLLDESSKNLILYNFRDDHVIASFPFKADFDLILDLLVYEDVAYILHRNALSIFKFKSGEIQEIPVSNPHRLLRENSQISVVTKNGILGLENNSFKVVFESDTADFVDKNSSAFFEIKDNKLYLYPIKK